MKKKSHKAWVITMSNHPIMYYAGRTRRCSIKKIEENTGRQWKEIKAQGIYKLQRIEVKILP